VFIRGSNPSSELNDRDRSDRAGHEGEEEGELFGGTVFGFAEGAVALGAAVAVEFLAGSDAKSGLAHGREQVGERTMVEGGLALAGFSRVGGDGDVLVGAVAIDAAELDFLIVVPTPMRALRNAETGVHEDKQRAATGFERLADTLQHTQGVGNIVQGHQTRGGIVALVRPCAGLAGVCDDKGGTLVAGAALFRGLDQALAGIDADVAGDSGF